MNDQNKAQYIFPMIYKHSPPKTYANSKSETSAKNHFPLSFLFIFLEKNRQKKQIYISSVLQIRYTNINKNSKIKRGAKSTTNRFMDVIEISLTMAKS